MGIWTTYCCLCGASPELIYDGHNEAEFKALKNKSWLKQFGAVLPSNKYAFGEYEAMGDIQMGTYKIAVDPIAYDDEYGIVKNGFLIHRKCYDIVKHIKDLYAKLNSFNRNIRISGYLKGLNYTPLEKYADQFFEWDKFINNPKDHYAIEDPTKNKLNLQRLKKNAQTIDKVKIKLNKDPVESYTKSLKRISKGSRKIKQLKSKSKSPKRSPSKSLQKRRSISPTRKSPSMSATLYPIGTKKKGIDGNTWVIKQNVNGIHRWVKV
jgi:hypothetical protein